MKLAIGATKTRNITVGTTGSAGGRCTTAQPVGICHSIDLNADGRPLCAAFALD